MRHRWMVGAAAVAAALLPVAGPGPAGAAAPTSAPPSASATDGSPASGSPPPALPALLTVTPARSVAPTTLTITGSCPPVKVDGNGRPLYPESTVVLVNGQRQPVELVDGAFAAPLSASLGPLAPGGYALTSTCGASSSVTVLAAPSLELTPSRERGGGQVTVEGTCPRPAGRRVPVTGSQVLLDGADAGAAPVDPSTGILGPFSLRIPDGAVAGEHRVTTDCGGTAALTVLPPLVTRPPVDDVVVPSVIGLTRAGALAAVAARRLVLAPGAGGGRVSRQVPAAGTRVPAGTVVTVVLAASVGPPTPTAGRPASSSTAVLPTLVVLLVVIVALAAAALWAGRRVLRPRRQRRWLDEHVGTAPRTFPRRVPAVPRAGVPRVDVRIAVRIAVRAQPRRTGEEAGDGHDRDRVHHEPAPADR